MQVIVNNAMTLVGSMEMDEVALAKLNKDGNDFKIQAYEI